MELGKVAQPEVQNSICTVNDQDRRDGSWKLQSDELPLGSMSKGCTPTHASKKGSQKGVLRRALQKVLRRVGAFKDKRVLRSLEAQQQYFSYRAILIAMVSQNSFVFVFH